MSSRKERSKRNGGRAPTPGIVLYMRLEKPPRPRVTAFIWGGKVRPVPALPYGRRSA
jgi:hypothetical protein